MTERILRGWTAICTIMEYSPNSRKSAKITLQKLKILHYENKRPVVLLADLEKHYFSRFHKETAPVIDYDKLYSGEGEKIVENRLCKYLDKRGIKYNRQVPCSAGIIDVLTESHLYEVKVRDTGNALFSAIGQLFSYRHAINNPVLKLSIVLGKDVRNNKWIEILNNIDIELLIASKVFPESEVCNV